MTVTTDDPVRIVLVAPRNPLNIGAVARAMSNFGFTDLRLVKPYTRAFQEARSAIRAHYILEQARVFDSVGPAVADCTLVVGTTAAARRNLHLPLHRLETAGQLMREQPQSCRIGLLFGSEKFGLSNEDMSHCHWLLRIPTREEHGSMNLGQAVAICLYELRRSTETARFEAPERAGAEQYEQITALLLDILARSGYVHKRISGSTELKVRRLIRRLNLSTGDVKTWLGMLRQILWKVKQSDSE